MLHVVLEKPGLLRAEERPEPDEARGEVLVRVHRIGICGTDLHAYAGRQPYFTYPRVLGHELGVEVLSGGEAAGLRPGDKCAVEPYMSCGRCAPCRCGRTNCCEKLNLIGVHSDGGMTHRIRVPAAKLHASPSLGYDQLALVEMLCVGHHAVERGQPGRGEFTLVIGAGPIGLSVVPFLRMAGARIAVMDVNESRLEAARRVTGVSDTLRPGDGAAEALREIGGGALPTCIYDATGNPKSMEGAFGLAPNGGRIVFVGFTRHTIGFDDAQFHRKELTIHATRNAPASSFRDVLAHLEAGRVDSRPWITHRLGLQDVPEKFGTEVAGNPAVLKAVVEV
jgi:2-desacetyl-2-hydroxyethyl bacteriochlorophyllide A dehydrogenase